MAKLLKVKPQVIMKNGKPNAVIKFDDFLAEHNNAV
jgi:hypothetical protein